MTPRPLASWTDDPKALELLKDAGPFHSDAFRESWVVGYPGWRDVSYGARLPDGTRAAVALLVKDRVAESVPFNYAGVVASRGLGAAETKAFLEEARRRAGAHRLIARSIPIQPTPQTQHVGARLVGWTSVVRVSRHQDLTAGFAKKATRKAKRGGGNVVASHDPSGFLRLYALVGDSHWLRYADELIRRLAIRGIGRSYEVRVDDRVVSAVFALLSANHWTAWLAAQDPEGRSLSGNYLAVAELLGDAQRSGVGAVNLGISEGMPGVAHFKRRFGAVDVPLMEEVIASRSALFAQFTAVGRHKLKTFARRACSQ